MLKIIIFIIFIIKVNVGLGAFENWTVDPYSTSRGGSSLSSSSSSSLWIDSLSSICVNIGVPYGIKELKKMEFISVLPFYSYFYKLGLTYFGNDIYSESEIIAMFRVFSYQNIHVYNKTQINILSSDIGNKKEIVSSCAIDLFPENDRRLFISILNILNIGNITDENPILLVDYLLPLTRSINTIWGLEKDSKYPINYKFAIDYEILEKIILSGGYSHQPDFFSSGLQINWHGWELRYAISYHDKLGLSHFTGISMNL